MWFVAANSRSGEVPPKDNVPIQRDQLTVFKEASNIFGPGLLLAAVESCFVARWTLPLFVDSASPFILQAGGGGATITKV